MNDGIHIVGIMSSPRINGNSCTLVRTILSETEKLGAQITSYHLPSKDISFCQGCFRCMAEGRCVLHDDFNEILQTMLQAQGLVIGGPTYGLAQDACMKNFFDRLGMFAVYTSSFRNAYVVGMSTCGRFGGKKVAKKHTEIVNGVFGSGQVTGTLGVQVGWKQVEDNPENIEKCKRLGKKLVYDIKTGKRYWYKRLGNKFITRFFMRPAMKKNIMEHKDDEMKGVYETLRSESIIGD